MSNRPSHRPSSQARIHAAQQAQQRSRAPWIIGAVGLVVVLALGIAVLATRKSDTPTAAPPGATVVPASKLAYGDVKVTGTPLPDYPQDPTAADPATGLAAPSLSGEQFDGKPITLPANGKPSVIMFVAHWCPHCQKEVPLIAKDLAATGLPADVNLYAVATATSKDRPNFAPGDWLNREGWPVPTLVDDEKGTAANAYGIGGFPFFVVLDAQGKVVLRTSGELPIEQFRALLDTARKSAPAAATSGSTIPAGAAKAG